MQQTETAYNVEDKGQIDALAEFAPEIRKILSKYRDERQLTRIAQKIDVNAARLTGMITTNKNGKTNRIITPYYLAKFTLLNTLRETWNVLYIRAN